MSTPRSNAAVSRRSAIAGLSAGGLGVAMAARGASAQDATPTATAGHPIVGTWIVDRNIATGAEAPVVGVFTADGGFTDAYQGATGVWEATGPNSVAFTLIAFNGPPEATTGYAVVRATWEIDASGETMSGPANVTVVLPDGTVVATEEFSSTATRLRVEPMDNVGSPLAAFPTWEPAPPADATPTA